MGDNNEYQKDVKYVGG